jgi:hypothetical protein
LGGGIPAGKFTKIGGDTRDSFTFAPTREWQTVPDDAVLPPGLEIRMDMNGGAKLARLMPEPAEFEL